MILRRRIRTAADRNAGRLVSKFRGGLFLRFFIRCRSAMAGGSSIAAGQAIVPDGNRLNCVAPVAANPTPDLYFVPSAFTNTVAGQSGTCGRNNLIASSQWNVDFSTLIDFRIAETHRIARRGGRPNAQWGSANTAPSINFGRIRSTSQLRRIEFALKHYSCGGVAERHNRLRGHSAFDRRIIPDGEAKPMSKAGKLSYMNPPIRPVAFEKRGVV